MPFSPLIPIRTISSLGGIGGTGFTPIVNPPAPLHIHVLNVPDIDRSFACHQLTWPRLAKLRAA